jgi:argininosuccinate lyase
MLAKVGLIAGEERDAIIDGLKSIERDIEADKLVFDVALEDIHMVIEAELIKRIGEPGRKLHTGRSRNDQVALDLTLWLQKAAWDLLDKLMWLQKAFATMAIRSEGIVMPSYTHLQRAQPIAAGAECLAWQTMFERDFYSIHRMPGAFGRFMPLGSGAIAGTSLPLNARATSGELSAQWLKDRQLEKSQEIDETMDRHIDTIRQSESIQPEPTSSIEHTATRDHACLFLFHLSMISQHLSRWAEQWIIYMSTEFSFLKIADRYTTSSSMMPQKRNPDMLELIRGRCGNVYGDLFALMTILKGLPIGYNRDLQEDKRIVFRAYDTVSSCLTMAAAIVNSASFIKENIEPTLDRGFLDATSLAEYLVTKGIPFRTAHHIVGTLVARCEKEGKHALSQLSVDAFNEVIATKSSVRVSDEVYSCLGARNVVARYQSAGAAGGKPFEEQLRSWKQRLGM